MIGNRADHVVSDSIRIGHHIPIRDGIYIYLFSYFKSPQHSNMATNITQRVIKLIALDNQLISLVEDQGFLHHLEF